MIAGSRRLKLAGCFDFRDLGGYPTVDGGRTRWWRLFRSDGLHRLTGDDQREVQTLGVSSVIDLRTPEEVADQGRFRLQATSYHQLPMADVLRRRTGLACVMPRRR